MQIKHPNVLSIAGIDPSGGAGLLADVKTISSLGGYATGVVTAATAQNTQGVFGVIPIPTDFVKKQIDVLFFTSSPLILPCKFFLTRRFFKINVKSSKSSIFKI